jgi:uncharacterized protein (DUF433 family)
VSEVFSEAAMIIDRGMVSATEFAYIAGVSDREVNRLVDERILPDFLFKIDNGRRFDLSAAALASFYFGAVDVLTAETRKSVIRELAERIKDEPTCNVVFECESCSHATASHKLDLHVYWRFLKIDMDPFVSAVCERATDAARASQTVLSDPEILGGEPVFAGTRVPVDNVLGSLDEGMSLENLQSSWSFLSKSLIDDARLYVKLHPRRGRPRAPNVEVAGWKLRSRKIIPPGTNDA